MRILWLKSDLLLPLDKGGKLRTWHLMRHLARQHEITYLAFAEPGTPREHIDGMKEVAARVETIERSDAPKGSFQFYVEAATHLVDPLPYACGKYRSSAYRAKLKALLDEQPFDLLVCDFLFPAVNLPDDLPCPSVMFTHNVESEIWRRHAETKTGALSKWLYNAQYKRMLRYEGEQLARFDGVLAVSDADAQTFERLYPDAIDQPVHVVQTGVDTEFFKPRIPNPESRTPALVFTGSMDWLPNEDAMQYFHREILPLIRAEEPDVQLSIVGRAPTPAVRKLAEDDGITVTGRVDDVRPFIEEAAVYVVPLRIGGGTRLKIFEAMAMGKAVVSTTVGAEGLPVVNGQHVLLADEPRTFARDVVRLIRDVDRRRQMEAAARALVTERFDWRAVARDLEAALVDIADRGLRDADSAVSQSEVNPQSAILNPQSSLPTGSL
ncbi:MAG TPA: glycosyltransferase [Vicinamibacterales bacterium]|nr:glycosyltransferase [Vicinamibacterales bacterium]